MGWTGHIEGAVRSPAGGVEDIDPALKVLWPGVDWKIIFQDDK